MVLALAMTVSGVRSVVPCALGGDSAQPCKSMYLTLTCHWGKMSHVRCLTAPDGYNDVVNSVTGADEPDAASREGSERNRRRAGHRGMDAIAAGAYPPAPP